MVAPISDEFYSEMVNFQQLEGELLIVTVLKLEFFQLSCAILYFV